MSFYDDYKKYLLDEIINGEIKLLGQIKCEESEYEYLVSYGNVIVAHLKNLANPKPDLLLAFLMVQIAINCYQDGNYWKYFEEELDTQLNGANSA